MCLLKCTSFNLSMSTILKVCFMYVYFHSFNFFLFFTMLVCIAVIYTLLISTPGFLSLWLASVQFSLSVVSNSLQYHGLQHASRPCPSPTPKDCSNSCPSSRWCHPTISSSVIPFFSCLQSFPTSGSFPRSQFFTSGGQNIGVSASTSVPAMNIQDFL